MHHEAMLSIDLGVAVLDFLGAIQKDEGGGRASWWRDTQV